MMLRGFVIRVALASAILLMINCSSEYPDQSSYGSSAILQATFLASSITQDIVQVSLNVTMDTSVVYGGTTEVVDGKFSFETLTLPVGEATFALAATNSSGATLYAGDTTLLIAGGIETRIEIELLPSIPMIKLSPHYSTVNVADRFTSTLELFNIEKFFNASFKIVYDPNYVTFDSTISQIDIEWGELVLFASDIGDTVVVSVSRTQGNPDDVPPRTYSLFELGFLASSAGRTTLELNADRLEDFDGAIGELPVLHIDNQTITIL